jgi:hypothetical protein
MITNIATNGSSDMNMSLPPKPPKPWANAGVTNINIPSSQQHRRSLREPRATAEFARDYSGREPDCNVTEPACNRRFRVSWTRN